jgi:hypothetical protein
VDIGVSIVIMQSAARAIDIIIAWKGSQLIQPNPGSGGIDRVEKKSINSSVWLWWIAIAKTADDMHAAVAGDVRSKPNHIPCRSILVCAPS